MSPKPNSTISRIPSLRGVPLASSNPPVERYSDAVQERMTTSAVGNSTTVQPNTWIFPTHIGQGLPTERDNATAGPSSLDNLPAQENTFAYSTGASTALFTAPATNPTLAPAPAPPPKANKCVFTDTCHLSLSLTKLLDRGKRPESKFHARKRSDQYPRRAADSLPGLRPRRLLRRKVPKLWATAPRCFCQIYSADGLDARPFWIRYRPSGTTSGTTTSPSAQMANSDQLPTVLPGSPVDSWVAGRRCAIAALLNTTCVNISSEGRRTKHARDAAQSVQIPVRGLFTNVIHL